MTSRMNGCCGQRTPTVSPPAVTKSGIAAARGSTMVSGPGQNAPASRSAASGHALTHARAMSSPSTWTMMGLCDGRPFTA